MCLLLSWQLGAVETTPWWVVGSVCGHHGAAGLPGAGVQCPDAATVGPLSPKALGVQRMAPVCGQRVPPERLLFQPQAGPCEAGGAFAWLQHEYRRGVTHWPPLGHQLLVVDSDRSF